MKTNTHKMAGTPAENGQMILTDFDKKKRQFRTKVRKRNLNALNNLKGAEIYSPITTRKSSRIGTQHYYRMLSDYSINHGSLDRNGWIDHHNFTGHLTEAEWMLLPEVQMYLMGKNIKDIKTIPEAELLLQESLEEEIPLTDTVSHTAGVQSPVVTLAEPGVVPRLDSEFDIYNVCVVQTQEIETLTGEVRKLGKLIDEDNELLVSMYHVGRKSVDALSALIDKVGRQIGINPLPPF